jgi:hypothetical protein
MHRLAAITLSLSLLSAPLPAQQLETHAFKPTPELRFDPGPVRALVTGAQDTDLPGAGAMVFTGTMSGALGLLAGGMLGYAMKSCTDDEWFCGMAESALGATIGEIILLPYGVHLNSRHSSYGSKFLASLGVAAAGIALAPATEGASLVAVIPLQLIAAISVEHSGREKARRSQESAR